MELKKDGHKRIEVTCMGCGTKFMAIGYFVRNGGAKYCTRSCHNDSKRIDVVERFWARVDKNGPNECWIYQGKPKAGGYCQIRERGKDTYTHRFSYELHNGPIPTGMLIQHSCDNPSCCNPDHLSLGTDKTNAEDKIRKGRQNQPIGERVWTHKLTPEIVLDIRAKYNNTISYRKWAKLYGVSPSAIEDIVKRITWTHI